MTTALQLLLLAASVTYIVDVSGFTESWRALLARVLHIRPENLRALPPFDCGKCATCHERIDALKTAGIHDTTEYATD